MVDYRALLVKYMAHILGEEGVTYLNAIVGGDDRGYVGGFGDVAFTAAEMAVLRALEPEARAAAGLLPKSGP